ncbi:MAG: signal peptidase II [Singulisphaera sp.]
MNDRPTSPPSPGPESPRPRVLLVVAGVALVADQFGKAWAFASWRGAAGLCEVIPGLYAGAQGRNYGALYSVDGVDDAPMTRIALTLLGVVSVGIMFRWAILDRERWRGLDAVGGGLVFAGAIGNLADRLALGYVRDFLIIGLRPHDIFNPADVFMIFGALLLVASWATKRMATPAAIPEAA